MLGKDTIQRWLDDCQAAEAGQPITIPPDDPLSALAPPDSSSQAEPGTDFDQFDPANGEWGTWNTQRELNQGTTMHEAPPLPPPTAQGHSYTGGAQPNPLPQVPAQRPGDMSGSGEIFQGDSYVDHGWDPQSEGRTTSLARHDSVSTRDTPGMARGHHHSKSAPHVGARGGATAKRGTGGHTATRSPNGGVTHVPSSQPAGTGAITPSAPPAAHVGRNYRSAAGLRDPATVAKEAAATRARTVQRRRDGRGKRPRQLTPLKKRGDRDGADTAWGESDGNDRTRASPSPAVGNQPPPYRLEPSFYLVDRQAIPARMPPSLQQFWERNPQLLPKDALSPANFKKIPPREITPHTYSRGAPLSLVEAARQDQHFGVRYNYDVNSFDVRCVAVCVAVTPVCACGCWCWVWLRVGSCVPTAGCETDVRRCCCRGCHAGAHSTAAKVDQLQDPEEAAVQLSGSMRSTLRPGRTGAGTTSGVTDVEIMGVSLEMKDDLARVLSENAPHMTGMSGQPAMELWHDEVGSALARPLDASVFVTPAARMMMHPSSSVAFDPDRQPWDARVGVFPYGAVAHESASRIQRFWHRYTFKYVTSAGVVMHASLPPTHSHLHLPTSGGTEPQR